MFGGLEGTSQDMCVMFGGPEDKRWEHPHRIRVACETGFGGNDPTAELFERDDLWAL